MSSPTDGQAPHVPDAPVRRSALDGIHRALGGSATDPRRQWPASYGDSEAERLAVEQAIGLAEPGLYDKWIARGPGALAACKAFGLDGRAGFMTPAAPGGITVWAIAEDEVWLVALVPDPAGPPIPAVDAGPAIAHLRSAGVYVTDVSSGWALFRMQGPGVRDLLEELVTEDLSPAAVPDQAILQVPLGGCRVVLARRDLEGRPGFTLLVAREDAEHLWDVLTDLGGSHGLRPVGAMAIHARATLNEAGPGGDASAGGSR